MRYYMTCENPAAPGVLSAGLASSEATLAVDEAYRWLAKVQALGLRELDDRIGHDLSDAAWDDAADAIRSAGGVRISERNSEADPDVWDLEPPPMPPDVDEPPDGE